MDEFALKKQAADLNVKAAEAQNAVNLLATKSKTEPKKFIDTEDKLKQRIAELENEVKTLKTEYKPEPIVLSPTEFALKQNLVALSLEINQAQNVLTELADKKAEFIGQQKSETLKAIKSTYEKSKQYLSEANMNLSGIIELTKTVQAIREVTESIMAGHKKDVNTFSELTKNVLKEIANEQEKLDTQNQEIIKQNKHLAEQAKQLEREKSDIEKEKKLIESRQSALKTAYEILKNKQYGR